MEVVIIMEIAYDKESNKFEFDFETDRVEDIIMLTGTGYQVEAFGYCFYYSYEFDSEVEGSVRSKFIKFLKFTSDLKNQKNLTDFIKKAIDDLHFKINLYDYDLVIMPESSSRVNQYMLRYIYRFAQPALKKMELVKTLPLNISFDMKAYEEQYLDDVLENGRPRYTESQKDEVRASINEMMDLVHKKDYFTIAQDVKKSKFRPYMMNFLKFSNEDDEELCRSIRKQNILIIDDVTTSGSTLNEVLRTLRIINEDNRITIFSLLGRNDLMADSF